MEKDLFRKPVEWVKFLGVRSGMTALDIGSAEGYSAEILPAAVGSEGKVIAQNNERATRLQNGYFIKTLRERAANNRLPHVEIAIWEMDEMSLDNAIDIAFWAIICTITTIFLEKKWQSPFSKVCTKP